MARPRRRILVAAVATLATMPLAGCLPGAAASTPTPGTTSATSPGSPSPSPTRSNLARPGEAQRMLERLLAAAGTGRVIMVEVTAETASVSVLPSPEGEPVTWAYRDGEVRQVDSDLQYVDQASFELDQFDVSDVGRLFRVAAAVSESTHRQTLQIVDYSGGRVVMAVTTNPESRTVFFRPDGSLLPELDYHTLHGITEGLTAVIDDRVTVLAVGVDSTAGAWIDYAGKDSTTIRRQRPAKVPVTTLVHDEPPAQPPFVASMVRPAAIWRVLDRTITAGDLGPDVAWTVTVDDRDQAGTPRMRFTIGSQIVVTDLAGNEVVIS